MHEGPRAHLAGLLFEYRPAMTPHRLWFALARRLSGQTTWLTAIISGVTPTTLNGRAPRVEIDAAFIRAVLELKYSQSASGIGEI